MKKILTGLLFSLWTTIASAGVPCTLPFNLLNNTIADATQVMANYNALVTCLTNAAAAGNNNDITALLALTTPISPGAGGSTIYVGGTSTGLPNAQIVASPVPSGFTLAAGRAIVFTAGFTNTAALTLAVNGTTASNLYRQTPSGPQAMTGGEVVSGQLIVAVYDGTQFEMISNGPQFGGFGPQSSLASAPVTDLGTIGSHDVIVTGNAAITSFGASANLAFPMYFVGFSGAPTITFNNTNCATTGGCIITPGNANINAASGDTAWLLYLGNGSSGAGNWQVLFYQRVNGASLSNPVPQCGFSGLTISPATTVTVSWAWNSATLNTSSNVTFFSGANSGTLNISNVGVVNGLDSGTVANNTFYYLWGISNGTTTGLLATVNVPPALPSPPSGYSYACYAGAVKTGGAATFFGTQQVGNLTVYKLNGLLLTANLPLIASGNQGAACTGAITWAPFTVRGSSGVAVWMPATASVGNFISNSAGGGGGIALAPNGSYTNTNTYWAHPNVQSSPVAIEFEANTIQYCSTAVSGASLWALGWKDTVNAN